MKGHTEECHLVAWSEDKNRLLEWYRSLKVEPYSDKGAPSFSCHGKSHSWNKVFRKGSVLEWYNPLYSENDAGIHGPGIRNEEVGEDCDSLKHVSYLETPDSKKCTRIEASPGESWDNIEQKFVTSLYNPLRITTSSKPTQAFVLTDNSRNIVAAVFSSEEKAKKWLAGKSKEVQKNFGYISVVGYDPQ